MDPVPHVVIVGLGNFNPKSSILGNRKIKPLRFFAQGFGTKPPFFDVGNLPIRAIVDFAFKNYRFLSY
jgi:hypothetical protein